MAGPQDDDAAGAELEEVLRRYPDTGRLVRDRASTICTASLVAA
ncbi:hypothetical protein ABGB18_48495 [Nonomuraea sp. B12E4]